MKRIKNTRSWGNVGGRRRWGILAGGICLSAWPGLGQDALRQATQGQQVYADLQRDAEQVVSRPEGAMRLGPVDAVFGLSLGVGYNDNVNLTPSNKEGSFIILPMGTARVFWQATDNGSLALSVGLGYQKYLNQPDLDRLTIAPNSVINYVLMVGSFRLRFQDTFTYSLDPVDVGAVSGTGSYGGFQNTVGLSADWELSKAVLTAGYNHYNFISAANASDQQQNQSDSVFLQIPFQINPAFSVGPQLAAGYTRFPDGFQNDNYNLSAGAISSWQPSDKLFLQGRAGYGYYIFLDSAMPLPPPNDEPPDNRGNGYGTLSISHTLSDALSHSLSAAHQIQSGIQAADSDAIQTTTFNYGITLNVIREVTFAASVGYTYAEEIGGLNPETYGQFIVSAGASYQLTKHISTSLNYQFANKNSDISANDYTQNSVWLTFGYTF